MMKIDISGTPIGGEDAREAKWTKCVAQASRLDEVMLRFRVEAGRKVDLDNLVRPATRGLRDAGFYSFGFPDLRMLTATKCFSDHPGLTVESCSEPEPGQPLLTAIIDSIPPSEETSDWIENWAAKVLEEFPGDPVQEPVWVAISTNSSRSLIGLMKPVIDGLEAFLGRDPSGRSRFYPNDDLIEWMQICRVKKGPAIHLSAGIL